MFSDGVELVPGIAPWAGLGVIGLLIGWLVLKHIPEMRAESMRIIAERDATIERLLTAAAAERDRERDMRRTASGFFQDSLGKLAKQHEIDAKNDREAFEHRSNKTVDALAKLSLKFEEALNRQTERMERLLLGDTKNAKSD